VTAQEIAGSNAPPENASREDFLQRGGTRAPTWELVFGDSRSGQQQIGKKNMANLQRMLGAMLASRMAGRGAKGGALGSAAVLSGLGGGRRGPASGLGGKLGLAALGYLAYRTYQEVQQDRARGSGVPKEQGRGGAGPLGGILDSLTGGGQGGTKGGSLSERIGDMLNPRQDEPEKTIPQDMVLEETISNNKALLLIRAMIAAANSDGQISPQERATILAKLDEAGADADDRRVIEKELQNPRPLDELLREVDDPETAQQFYLASRTAVSGTNEVQTSYLSYLRQRLKLPDDAVAEVEKLAS
jgi:uncharacterized membrane protein YebE (DUF533 family)